MGVRSNCPVFENVQMKDAVADLLSRKVVQLLTLELSLFVWLRRRWSGALAGQNFPGVDMHRAALTAMGIVGIPTPSNEMCE